MVLKAHARHYVTDEPIPDELLARMRKARKFNEGFSTVEYTASALVDTALHKASAADIDIARFEVEELQRLGMPEGIIMRHRPAHFQREPLIFYRVVRLRLYVRIIHPCLCS